MSFITDNFTLDDLNIRGRYKPDSVFSLFNSVSTRGGGRLLESMFHHPLPDATAINCRSATFRYFHQLAVSLPFGSDSFEKAESYLTERGSGNIIAGSLAIFRKQLLAALVRDERYQQLLSGLQAAIEVLLQLRTFLPSLTHPGYEKGSRAATILNDPRLDIVYAAAQQHLPGKSPFSPRAAIRCDHVLRTSMHQEMQDLLEIIYDMDVCITVSRVAREKGFSYARALPKEDNCFRATGLRHPALPAAVANTLSFHSDSNLLFLTGANMAGKSTLMKALGIAVYLAHMGFPVAAEEMGFSVMDGIYSSINVPDDLSHGYSHFYAEVLRVKKVAEAVSSGRSLVIIFDELFKGTNVKDAYDATLAVTEGFSAYRNCFFLVSTHIVEVGENLKEKGGHFQFAFMPTIMEGSRPRYTYKLEKGISADRHGMMIIQNEGIIGLIG